MSSGQWDSERASAAAKARWRKPRPGDPFAGTFLDFTELAGFTGPSWDAWRVHWKAADGLPLTEAERVVFQRHTGREMPPTSPVAEIVDVCGRRSGKSRGAAARAFFEGIRQNYLALLAPGELGVIPIIAADRKQAGQALGYVKGLAQLDAFRPYVARVLKEAVALTTGVTIEIHTASYRVTRGYTVCSLVADEISFWRSDDTGANPDAEVLGALRPGMATVPGARLMMISTPYARRGELFRAYERYFGKAGARVLVWCADTASMNPTIDPAIIEDAFLDDPIAAASEYGRDGSVVFRSDVEEFLSVAAVDAVTVLGRRELPRSAASHVAFVDPSGGSADSFVLAIAHRDGERGVLDLVREVRPPFSPEAVVRDFAAVLKSYGLSSVTGDHYAGEWPRERFTLHGITYVPSEATKSDLYRELLPLVNAGRVELLDLPLLRAQLVGLERKVARGGKDSIDHGPGGHDDVANAAAGALVLAAGGGFSGWDEFMANYDVHGNPLHPEPVAAAPAAPIVREPAPILGLTHRVVRRESATSDPGGVDG